MLTQKNNLSGFTLLELMIVIGIGMITAAIAVPNFLSWRDQMYVRSAARDMYSAIQDARMIAIRNNSATAVVFDIVNSRYYTCDNWGADGTWTGPNDTTGTGDNNIVQTIDLASYGGDVLYGGGNIVGNNSVTGNAIPADGISYGGNDFATNSRGTGEAGYVYLQNFDGDRVYAVGTQANGNVRLLRWDGGNWQ